jgi:hypothetical protein
MKTMLLAAAAAVALAAPASAQVYFGADPGGVGVQVGPLGAGVGPRYDRPYYGGYYGDDWDHAYNAGDCRVIRSKIVRPDGRVVYRTRRMCD